MSSLPSCTTEFGSRSFKDLHSKARLYLWESVFSKIKPNPEETVLLKKITEISPRDPDFENLMKAQLMGKQNEKIVKLMQKVLAATEKPAGTFKETVVLKTPAPSIAKVSASILPALPEKEALGEQSKESLLKLQRARHHSQIIDIPQESKIVPLTEQKQSPPRTRRANTETVFFESLKEYPRYIQTPKGAAELVQNAICIRFLFPEIYKRLFDKKDQAIFERLIDFHFLSKYRGLVFQESVKKCFEEFKNLDRGKRLGSAFSKLMKRQTVSKIQGAPKMPQNAELSKIFDEHPFDTPEATEDYLQNLSSIKYLCVATFQTYEEDVKQALNLILQASILRDILHYPYKSALKIVLSQNTHIKEESFQKLANLSGCQKKHMPAISPKNQDPKATLQNILKRPEFAHEKTFATFMAHAEGALDKTFNPRARNLLQLLTNTALRLQREPILFKSAMQSSFTLTSLKALFGKDDAGNLEDFKLAISSLSPKVFLAHPALESDDLFETLKNKARTHFQETSKDLDKVLKTFVSLEETSKRDPSLRREDLIFIYFNEMALRELFNLRNDIENAKLLSKCIDEILKR